VFINIKRFHSEIISQIVEKSEVILDIEITYKNAARALELLERNVDPIAPISMCILGNKLLSCLGRSLPIQQEQ
jgi:hypothetical protein